MITKLAWVAVALLALTSLPTFAQVNLERGNFSLTTEGYANATAGDGDFRLDAAARVLARWKRADSPDIGLRVAVESSPEDRADLAEASLLLLGGAGRLEIGDRQGLPDVLLGYAPNNFTFTGAEFGPASGPSLDPAGGLQAAFAAAVDAPALRELSVLGFAPSLSDDRSAKALYVTPKLHGWLAGASYAPNATDARFAALAQFGLTHDTYWDENQLHVGGSASAARSAHALGRDLYSVNVGATLVLDYDWMLGLGAGYDASAGTVNALLAPAAQVSGGWGAVASVNFNRGRWTLGAFAQRGERDELATGPLALTAFEAGVSYRLAKTARIYGAWYDYEIDSTRAGRLFLLGLRLTL